MSWADSEIFVNLQSMPSRNIYEITEERIGSVTVRYLCKDVKRISLRVKMASLAQVSYPPYVLFEEVRSFVHSHSEWILRQAETMRDAPPFRPYSPEEVERFRQLVISRFDHWMPLMNLYHSHVSISLMKTRWGSCNKSSRRISINLELARHPLSHLDYVIVHELAHLREANHSPRFWSIVETFYPRWREIRAEMRKQPPRS